MLESVPQLGTFRETAPAVRVAVLVTLGIGMELAVRTFVPRWTRRIAKLTDEQLDLERRQRSATVVKFSSSVARLVVWTIIFVSLLSEININVGPLLAGAGVLGAALAFGAQNVIRDYLAGFFILLENQYTLGDVVRIGSLSGSVEEITMRITVLRGADGAMHVIPNGTIQAVSNLTSGWARALVDVGVAYQTEVDTVLDALRKVATAFYADPAYQADLLEAPEVLGVMGITALGMTLRISVKVVAEQQWKVQRELLRRVKVELDARQIAPPTPQLTES